MMSFRDKLDDMKHSILDGLLHGNGVEIHISKMDIDEKYDTMMWIKFTDVNETELVDSVSFELEDVSNNEIDNLVKELDSFIKDSIFFLTKG